MTIKSTVSNDQRHDVPSAERRAWQQPRVRRFAARSAAWNPLGSIAS